MRMSAFNKQNYLELKKSILNHLKVKPVSPLLKSGPIKKSNELAKKETSLQFDGIITIRKQTK